MTITNCDLNTYSHIPYKPLQDSDYKQKKPLQKQLFYARIKRSIVEIFYMGYFKLYYSLLDLKKIVISTYVNVKIYIEFELLNY